MTYKVLLIWLPRALLNIVVINEMPRRRLYWKPGLSVNARFVDPSVALAYTFERHTYVKAEGRG